MSEKVLIFDTTLRDGEQAAGAAMTAEEKLEIARKLERLNVDIIEAGFPVNSEAELQAVKTITREIRTPIICALSHANANAVDKAWEALKEAREPRIHVFLSSSDTHIMHQLRKNREEVMNMAVASVARAKKYVDNVEFSPMDATRTEPEYLYTLVEATIKAGATTINIPDTVGYAIPEEFEDLLLKLRENVPLLNKVQLSVHCHNDLGLAVANSLAAVRAGARQVEGCINGLGERAGNASLEEVIMALETRSDFFGISTNINTPELYSTSRLVSDITGFTVQPNKAIVGLNAFRHASGIHQDGLLKDRTTYEIMDPKSVGVPSSTIILGKLSGRAGLRARLEELGYYLEQDELNQFTERFKELAEKKHEVTDRDLEIMMSEERRGSRQEIIYKLDHVQVSSGDHGIPTATVRITDREGTIISDASTGTGPVDAVYKAINRVVDVPNTLTEFTVKSVTEGIDAVGEVTIRIERGGRVYVGRSADTDIIVASARAYMNALNRLISLEGSTALSSEKGTS